MIPSLFLKLFYYICFRIFFILILGIFIVEGSDITLKRLLQYLTFSVFWVMCLNKYDASYNKSNYFAEIAHFLYTTKSKKVFHQTQSYID